jgi:lysozyme family protein
MALFELSFTKTMQNEGGYLLHNVTGDHGGKTFAGIAMAFWPDWRGWALLEQGNNSIELERAVKEFYKDNFWCKINGDNIKIQQVADTIYDFAVNAGVVVAVKLAQEIVKEARDGVIGPATLRAINLVDPDFFVARYCCGRVGLRAKICNRDKSQSKFLLGWINRDLGSLG